MGHESWPVEPNWFEDGTFKTVQSWYQDKFSNMLATKDGFYTKDSTKLPVIPGYISGTRTKRCQKPIQSYWCALSMKFLDSRVLNWWNVFKVDHWPNLRPRISDVSFTNWTVNPIILIRIMFCYLFRIFFQFCYYNESKRLEVTIWNLLDHGSRSKD